MLKLRLSFSIVLVIIHAIILSLLGGIISHSLSNLGRVLHSWSIDSCLLVSLWLGVHRLHPLLLLLLLLLRMHLGRVELGALSHGLVKALLLLLLRVHLGRIKLGALSHVLVKALLLLLLLRVELHQVSLASVIVH